MIKGLKFMHLLKTILKKVDWKIMLVRLIRFYVYSIVGAVIISVIYINGWWSILGQGNISCNSFWRLQNGLFYNGLFYMVCLSDVSINAISVIFSSKHTHDFKYKNQNFK